LKISRYLFSYRLSGANIWLQGRLAEVLPVPYAHLVFTLPHSLNTLYGVHSRRVIDTLFGCAAQTPSEFAANPKWMGCKNDSPAFSLVLHTWTQDLQRHLHVHAVMACGVLDKAVRWSTPTRKPDFLLPVPALSRVFRGKFMAALAMAHRKGEIEQDPQGTSSAWRERQKALYRHQSSGRGIGPGLHDARDENRCDVVSVLQDRETAGDRGAGRE
jgi:hypothetical protein